MIKLIVNAPTGVQELIEIDASGSYFDESLVVWDERKHGKLSAEQITQVGGLVRSGSTVTFDNAKFQAQKVRIDAEKSAAVAKRLAQQQAREKRKQVDWAQINTIAELKAVLKDVVDSLGD